MSCNCNIYDKCGFFATMQTGDTFPVYLAYKNDDVLSALEQGMNIIAAFYNYKGQLICEKRTDRGEITVNEDGIYQFKVTHEESMNMLGKVGVELTLTQGDDVYHGDKIVSVAFEYRRNNDIV